MVAVAVVAVVAIVAVVVVVAAMAGKMGREGRDLFGCYGEGGATLWRWWRRCDAFVAQREVARVVEADRVGIVALGVADRRHKGRPRKYR